MTKAIFYDDMEEIVKIVNYVYDPMNRLVRRATTVTDVQTEYFVFDGPDIIQKWVDPDGTGAAPPALDRRYLNGPAIDQILAEEDKATNAVSYMLQDRQGSVTDILDDSGSVIDHIFYDGYGNADEDTPSVEHSYGYAGYFIDEATGFNGTQTRWYDPVSGRWTSEDPIGFGGGDSNLWRYVGNSPTLFVDPSGLKISADQVKAGLAEFSCRCGWIDWTHAGREPGKISDKVWNTILNESGKKSLLGGGFKVTITLGTVWQPWSYTSNSYYIPYDLSRAQKESVFLTIWMETNVAFESKQIGSKFSEEDLPSDWIYAYRVLKGYTRQDIEKICGAVTDVYENLIILAEWERMGWTTNHGHVALDRNTTYGRTCCTDETWPAELETISYPAKHPDEYRPWRTVIKQTTVGIIPTTTWSGDPDTADEIEEWFARPGLPSSLPGWPWW